MLARQWPGGRDSNPNCEVRGSHPRSSARVVGTSPGTPHPSGQDGRNSRGNHRRAARKSGEKKPATGPKKQPVRTCVAREARPAADCCAATKNLGADEAALCPGAGCIFREARRSIIFRVFARVLIVVVEFRATLRPKIDGLPFPTSLTGVRRLPRRARPGRRWSRRSGS